MSDKGDTQWGAGRREEFEGEAARQTSRLGLSPTTAAWDREQVRARLAAIVEAASDAIISVSLDGAITTWNPGAEQLYGYTRDEALGSPCFMLVPAEQVAEERAALGRLARGEPVAPYETVRVRKDGARVDVSIASSPLRDGAGRVVGASIIARDISDAKEMERMRSEWISTIAHDMRQPLTIIIGYARTVQGIMAQRAASGFEIRALEHIVSAAGNLNRIIADLLDVSRLETRRLRLDRKSVDLAALLQDVVERVASVTGGRQVNVTVQGLLPPVDADPARVEQVLGNLLSNAAKYSYTGTPIEVRVRRCGEMACVSVANQGEGIPYDEQGLVFARFRRTGSGERGAARGIGLGLYIAKGLVEAHGGRIWVDSVPGGTTTFHFSLPLAAESRTEGAA